MILAIMRKDPTEVWDLEIDWSSKLVGGETIADSEWEIVETEPALVVDTFDNDDTSTSAWVRDGADFSVYSVLNRITTTANRVYVAAIKIDCLAAQRP